MRRLGVVVTVFALPLLFVLVLSIAQLRTPAFAGDDDANDPVSVHAEVVATGIPGAGAIAQIGKFHTGGPFHDNPALAPATQPGQVLDGTRLFVASSSNFGAPLARQLEAPGAILSLDVSGGAGNPVAVPRRLRDRRRTGRRRSAAKSFSIARRVPLSSTASRIPMPQRATCRQ